MMHNIKGQPHNAVLNFVHMELTNLGKIIDKNWCDISNQNNEELLELLVLLKRLKTELFIVLS